MAVKEFIPVRPAAGGLVHATAMEFNRKTICGKKYDGWVISPDKLTCPKCHAAIAAPLEPKKRRKAA